MSSPRNYGILWDNYSITKVGDTRNYEPLSTLKLYAADGSEGWLTATYAKKSDAKQVIVQRPESVLAYDFLLSQKDLPAEVKLGGKRSYLGRCYWISLYWCAPFPVPLRRLWKNMDRWETAGGSLAATLDAGYCCITWQHGEGEKTLALKLNGSPTVMFPGISCK